MQNRTGFQGTFVTMVTMTYLHNSVVGWFMRFILGSHVPWAIQPHSMTVIKNILLPWQQRHTFITLLLETFHIHICCTCVLSQKHQYKAKTVAEKKFFPMTTMKHLMIFLSEDTSSSYFHTCSLD